MAIESKIQKQIRDYLETIGYVRKIIIANRAGTADLLCCIKGKFVAVEVKKDDKTKESPLQTYNKKQVELNGGYSFVVGSLEELKKELKLKELL